MLSLTQLFTLCLTYLAILFGSAYATERGIIPQRVATHPFTRMLSLAVVAGALAVFGALESAYYFGGNFLLYFLGISAAFIAAGFIFAPLSRVALDHKLGSIADLFAFRYPAPWVGGLITLLMLVGLLPLLALQIHAVSVTMHALNQDLSQDIFSAIFCATMTLFAILFGARHLSTRDKHPGLILAIGLESIIKLLALLAVAVVATLVVFENPGAMFAWVNSHGDLLRETETTLSAGASRSLLLIFFAASVTMPHIYHMLITENEDETTLQTARWGLPLYLLLTSLCIPPLIWAALKLGVSPEPALFPIAIAAAVEVEGLALIAFLAGLAASSGVLIVTTLALATMTQNHILLPLTRPIVGGNFYSQLLNTRRLLIATIIVAAYVVHKFFTADQGMMTIGVIACIATAQFLPALLAVFYWRHANRYGLLAGVSAGFLVWLLAFLPLPFDVPGRELLSTSDTAWGTVIWGSLALNSAMLVLVSLFTKQSSEESYAALVCMSRDTLLLPVQLEAKSVPEMQTLLASELGDRASSSQVNLALSELRYKPDEVRPYALSQLRTQMETNLASVVGQTIAHRIIRRVLPLVRSDDSGGRVHVLESHLEAYQNQLTGLAAELNELRRLHRQTLHDLPTAVCSIDRSMTIRGWNKAMEQLTGVTSDSATGLRTIDLPEPWQELLNKFIYGEATNLLRHHLASTETPMFLNLHKAAVMGSDPGDHLVIVIEDLTETQQLEAQLMHKERLASIGQLAAGVAHEIGNPVTGIACLAQNLRMDFEDDNLQEVSNQILVQTDRVSSILQTLMSFAHGGKPDAARNLIPVEIHRCIDEAITLLSLENRKDVLLTNSVRHGLKVMGDPQRLAQVFVNILSNSLDASDEGGSVIITSQSAYGDGDADDNIRILVTDEGHGIERHRLDDIFDPFFTTKDPGVGTGLGLAIVSTIIAEHSGHISVSANSPRGNIVTISLPRAEGPAEERQTAMPGALTRS